MTRLRDRGLTVVEVLVSLVILALGVAGAVQLQAMSLRFSNQAEHLKTATQVAEAEVEWRRQTEVVTGSSMSCATVVPTGYSCQVDVVPCNAIAGSSTLTCEIGLVSPTAYRIDVTAGSDLIPPFTLSTVTTGVYVTGVLGDGDVVAPPPPTGGETGGGGDTGGGGAEEPKPCIEWAGKSGNCKKWAD